MGMVEDAEKKGYINKQVSWLSWWEAWLLMIAVLTTEYNNIIPYMYPYIYIHRYLSSCIGSHTLEIAS